jgi:hypothetical protein
MKETFISTRRINVDRVTLTSRKPLQDVLSKFGAAVGRPDIERFSKRIGEVAPGIVDERGEGNWAVTVQDSNQGHSFARPEMDNFHQLVPKQANLPRLRP